MSDRGIAALIFLLALGCFLPLMIHGEPVQKATEAELVAYIPQTPTERPTPEPTKEPMPTMTPTPTEAPTPTEEPEPTEVPEGEMPEYQAPPAEGTDDLQLMYMTCYLPTGNNCADGTPPHPGVCASAPWLIGKDCILYDIETLEVIARLECRDTGGHPMLQNGTAIDVFQWTMDDAWAWVGEHGTHVYVRWVERE